MVAATACDQSGGLYFGDAISEVSGWAALNPALAMHWRLEARESVCSIGDEVF